MPRLLLACLLALVSSAASAALNLNTATKEDLVALQGIGPSKAQAILDYRAAHGGFKTIDELKDVKGIGAKRFEKLKAELTVTPLAARAAPARSPDAKGAVTKGEIKAAGDAKHK
ncbi:MAG TPA: helix-hairpin-helix domain-containing protein [Casimicrobiaceae bacterium]|jgi:competence protein ComEA|nr:helix-hairpin-helix domain-containing protein [Casimicrobiaceae bacterium]